MTNVGAPPPGRSVLHPTAKGNRGEAPLLQQNAAQPPVGAPSPARRPHPGSEGPMASGEPAGIFTGLGCRWGGKDA